ncbi:hypothetical protein [Evansella clarkii]|uniref:hypothetical protein n=1 Tax=Evansella clarkii TaxID=79879 RepID=UPI001065CE6D|nr:hypothetical protein [Evansella clarkii]
MQRKTATVSSSAPAVTRRKKSFASSAPQEYPSIQIDAFAVKKMLVPTGEARAENPFLAAVSRQKLVEAVPAERVRLKRKSNNKITL